MGVGGGGGGVGSIDVELVVNYSLKPDEQGAGL